jgi:hypothetical protein
MLQAQRRDPPGAMPAPSPLSEGGSSLSQARPRADETRSALISRVGVCRRHRSLVFGAPRSCCSPHSAMTMRPSARLAFREARSRRASGELHGRHHERCVYRVSRIPSSAWGLPERSDAPRQRRYAGVPFTTTNVSVRGSIPRWRELRRTIRYATRARPARVLALRAYRLYHQRQYTRARASVCAARDRLSRCGSGEGIEAGQTNEGLQRSNSALSAQFMLLRALQALNHRRFIYRSLAARGRH